MNTKKSHKEICKVLKNVLSSEDLKKIATKTSYSPHTVRMVLFGYQPVTDRNQKIIDEGIKTANTHLQKSLKTLGHGIE